MYHAAKTYQYYHVPLNDILYNVENLPEDKDIWAFAYKEDERALNLICKPVKGQIKNRYFYEYKTNGKDLRKNGVRIYSRYFADTYEEAVIGFNTLILERISALETEITRLNDMLIHNN